MEATDLFWAWLDGFTAVGPFGRARIPGAPTKLFAVDPTAKEKALLDLTRAEFLALGEEEAKQVTQRASARHQRHALYAGLGMGFGSLCLMACFAAFAYLVIHNHPVQAGVVLSTVILGFLVGVVTARLHP
jgi:hypothetical protein